SRCATRANMVPGEDVSFAVFHRDAIAFRPLDVLIDHRRIPRKTEPKAIIAVIGKVVVELVAAREARLKGVVRRGAAVVVGHMILVARGAGGRFAQEESVPRMRKSIADNAVAVAPLH